MWQRGLQVSTSAKDSSAISPLKRPHSCSQQINLVAQSISRQLASPGNCGGSLMNTMPFTHVQDLPAILQTVYQAHSISMQSLCQASSQHHLCLHTSDLQIAVPTGSRSCAGFQEGCVAMFAWQPGIFKACATSSHGCFAGTVTGVDLLLVRPVQSAGPVLLLGTPSAMALQALQARPCS